MFADTAERLLSVSRVYGPQLADCRNSVDSIE